MKIRQNNNTSITNYSIRCICRIVLMVGLPFIIISGLTLSMRHSSAYNQSSDSVTLSIPVSCTLTATINNAHSISMASGTYQSGIGKTTMKTTCNDTNGYVVYAIGNTNNEEGNNTLSSIVLGQDYNIPTGLNTSAPASGEDVSNWAMKLTPVAGNYSPILEDNYNNKYALVPNTWTKVASRNSGTIDMTEGSSFTTTYAVYLKATQPAGTYAGQVKYIMFHPASSPKPVPTIEDAYELASKTKIDHILDPETGEYGSYYAMQDMTTGICEAVSLVDESTETKLVDIRDNKLYYVTKLQDGHCWMTQNLDLDLDSSVALTSETTDLNDGTLSGTYSAGYSIKNGIISWKPMNSTMQFSGTSVPDWVHSATVPYSASKIDDDAEIGHGSLGNYYNWTIAIASNDSRSLTIATHNLSKNPQNSICPKGWRLPTMSGQSGTLNGSTNEFARINYLYNYGLSNTSIGLTSAPIYVTLAGFINNRQLNEYENNGKYWYATTESYYNSPYFSVSDNSVATGATTDSRWMSGFSLRCLAR